MKIIKIAVILGLMSSLAFSAGFEKDAKRKDMSVHISAEKSLVVGGNKVTLSVTHKKQVLKNAEVMVKVFMPAMPGMPYMEYKAKMVSNGDGTYTNNIQFAMGGTWQVHIFVNNDGKKYKIKSSVNL